MNRLEKNDAKMVRWMCNVRSEDRASERNLGLTKNRIACGNAYRTEDHNSLVIWK